MPYDNIISRTDAAALMPEEASRQILENVPQQSAALTLFRRAPNMSRAQQRMPVASALPQAYFVTGDTGLKQTTEKNWANKYLNVEEIACFVPIPKAVLDDSDYDIWASVRMSAPEAIGRTLDGAIFFGTNKPASWPTAIVTAAASASNTYTRGTNNAAAGGVAEDFNQLFGLVEADGFDVNGVAAARSYKARLRGARSTTGEAISNVDSDRVYNEPISYPMRGLWPTGSGAAEAIAGDFSQGIIAVRQDITYDIFTEAALFDDNGNLIYNLPQQDMVAMRIVFRVAFQVSNVVNWDQPTEASRYPWAVMIAP
jgi:HK97 family phage major capsid protein